MQKVTTQQWWSWTKQWHFQSSSNFKHKITKEVLWIDDGGYHSSWMLREEQRRRGMLISSPEVGKEENHKDSKTMCLYLVTSLKACAKKKDLYQGSSIHADICNSGLLANNTYLGNALVSMYAKCGALVRAQHVLDELPVRDVVSWNALIAGYAQHGQGKEALRCFHRMQCEDLFPDAITYACILKACGITQEADMGKQIHDEIVSQGLLEKNIVLGNALVDMYAKCGLLTKAQKVLDELPLRNVVSWNTLIAGYAQQAQGEKALGCFHRMQREGFSPSTITYACILKACGITQAVDMGKQIHDEIVSQGLLGKDVVLGNALVDMYAKCGVLTKAQKVLDELPIQNVVSWNALIAGYAQQGQGQEALICFNRMRSKGFSPNAITYACILKACGRTQEADTGKQIHDEIVSQRLLEKNVVLGNALVHMYAKCGLLTKAQKVLDELPVKNVGSWNALIAGYAQQRQGEEALGCFQRMQSEGLSPDAITYACILKACSITKEVDKGKQIHDEIVSQGLLGENVVLGNALVDMYAKCGVLTKAQKVLDELPIRNVVCWSALIAGYAQQRQGEEALGCFQRMRSEGLSPDAITYAYILRACGITQEADMGKQIHDEIVSQGLLENNVVLGNALVDMYAKCGVLTKAQKVLDELPVRNVISWNALIKGYAQKEQGQEALSCFHQMRREGLSPDAITYACILKVCGITQEADIGKQIHDEIVRQRLLEKNVVLGNALIDMYVKCGVLSKAQKVLDELPAQDVVSWNALIAGYAQQGQSQEALGCFHQMRSKGFSPNAITYACILKACGIMQEADMGKQIRDEIVSRGLLEKNVVLGNALVDMYAKCGVLMKAQKVLDELPVQNVVSWNALIAGYAQQGQGQEALGCFHRMQIEGFSPDPITYACILKACGITQEVDMGQQIHDEIVSQGLLEKNVVLGNALVDMYAKCGVLAKAQKVLDELPVRDIFSWNALIAGYAQQGQGEEALGCLQQMRSEGFSPNVVSWSALIGGYAQQGLAEKALDCFHWMQQEGNSPNAITFVSVLNACSHSGLVDEGQMYFEIMKEKYGITPDKEHYTCMVDLFGRARQFDKAMRVIKMMPSSDYPPVWSALLGACHKCGNVMLGRLAFEHAVQLDGRNAEAYVLMANIYAAAGMQEDAQNIERMRMKIAPWKQPGGSCWVDASGNVKKFAVDTKHPHSRRIYADLDPTRILPKFALGFTKHFR